jgi:hypothetical protein
LSVKLVPTRNPAKGLLLRILAVVSLSSILVAQTHQRGHGSVDGHTYTDPRFGLRYSFPAELENMTSLPGGIPVGTGEKSGVTEFLFSAMEKPNRSVRRGVLITTDPLGAFGAVDVPSYLRKLMVLSLGAKEPIEVQSVTIGERTFSRTNINAGVGTVSYGAQLSTLCRGEFLTFYFSGPSPEAVAGLVSTLDKLSLNCSTGNP